MASRAAIALAGLLVAGCGGTAQDSSPTPVRTVAKQEAIKRAFLIYHAAKKRGIVFSNGPCISNGSDIPGWVVDIAHRPRIAADDDPRNQCSAYVNGTADYFIELDPQGHLLATG